MGSLFCGARLRLLAWDAEYGPEVALDAPVGNGEEVDLAVEVEPARWQPIQPHDAVRPARVVFVDGVRRIDVRLLGTRGDAVFHGLFGSYAVGTVVLQPGSARLGTHVVGRRVVLGAGEALREPVTIAPALTYEPLSTPEREPDAPLRALQSDMRRVEEAVARDAAAGGDALVVADGPLTFEGTPGERVVGYVKRVHDLHLPHSCLPLLAALPAGARTPLFALRHSKRFARYSWFVRLAAPAPGAASLYGLARLEVVASIGAEAARALADQTAALLPGLAPSPVRDPRSPQNLLPIGGLEAHLRTRLGDRRVVAAAIERAVVKEALHEPTS